MSEAAAAIRWLMQQGEPEARRVAVQQVAKVRGPEASELLLRALGDDDWRVRKEAAGIAPSLEDREEVVAALVAALEETLNIGLRNAAVEALVAIGRDAVGAIVESMSRLDADARKLAVEVLGGAPEPHGIAALVRTLADERHLPEDRGPRLACPSRSETSMERLRAVRRKPAAPSLRHCGCSRVSRGRRGARSGHRHR